MPLNGPQRPPRSGTAKQLILLLHGWGADGANLIDLGDVMADALPDAHFIAPNGPEVCEVNPCGYQWFPLMDRNPAHLLSGTRRAAEMLDAFIDAKLKELGLNASALALTGFSQGTMLALHAALRRTPQLACVVGFSGALIGADLLASEIAARPPVCLIHGKLDEVVPYASMARAESALKAAGVPVETHTRPMIAHSIDMEGINTATRFLARSLGLKKVA